MLILAFIFLFFAVMTGTVGFSGLFGAAAEPAKFLCFAFLVMVALCMLIRAIRSAPYREGKRDIVFAEPDSTAASHSGESHVQDRGPGNRRRVA